MTKTQQDEQSMRVHNPNAAGLDIGASEIYAAVPAGPDEESVRCFATLTAQTIISEIGLDMSRWKTVKHFASWLGVAPNSEKSGGKVRYSFLVDCVVHRSTKALAQGIAPARAVPVRPPRLGKSH